MKFVRLSFVIFSFAAFTSYSQVKDATQNIKQQSAKMGQSFINGDYAAFAKYTYPKLLAAMGGEIKMAAALTKVTNDMKSKGMSLNSITFSEPSKIIKSDKELQATIAQHTDIKVPDGRAVSTSTLIAISTDNGISWTFIDTSNKNIAALRKAMPNLSTAITIPPQQPPVHYDF
ncbi:MAG: hypothetical protein ABI261_03365 [Ginsengibacter sp.]